MAAGRAHAINVKTQRDIQAALENEDEDDDALDKMFEKREQDDAPLMGLTLAKDVAGFALVEACNQAKREGNTREMVKEWVTGPNSRPTHTAMNGEQVPIDDTFSNGARWPGDDNLDPDESCGCNCTTEVVIR
jgi:hypothetical protein